ncbi:hypothetical protein GIB67_012287 [Kingdonia uniflora]|uniref:HTH myb-type domain-containing protein n=1 Tax=Kingdonia uniflora TaxID=39325 RepID=A0A7J7LFV9_9MAGN|nr:hypothetical protein GIB67_012287 [Kingdonia uniflora]
MGHKESSSILLCIKKSSVVKAFSINLPNGVLVQSLQEEVKELREEVVLVQGLKDEVASLRFQMAKLEKFMPNQISAQDQTTLPESSRLVSQGNHIPSRPVKCKLFWLTPSNVVATGHWYNEEPTCKVHNVPLGIGMSMVSTQIALKEDVPLARGNDHLKTIGDACGSLVAWPTPFIIKELHQTGGKLDWRQVSETGLIVLNWTLSTFGVCDLVEVFELKSLFFLAKALVDIYGLSLNISWELPEIAPVCSNKSQLHKLAASIVSPQQCLLLGFSSQDSLSAESRPKLLDKVHKFLPPTVMIPERRSEHLVEQALTVQREACVFHNSLDSSIHCIQTINVGNIIFHLKLYSCSNIIYNDRVIQNSNGFPLARKPYTITKQGERWTDDEHNRFLQALKLYGRAWQEHIGTKTTVQIRSHVQKFFSKVNTPRICARLIWSVAEHIDLEGLDQLIADDPEDPLNIIITNTQKVLSDMDSSTNTSNRLQDVQAVLCAQCLRSRTPP